MSSQPAIRTASALALSLAFGCGAPAGNIDPGRQTAAASHRVAADVLVISSPLALDKTTVVPGDVLHALQSRAIRLAGLELPANLDASTAAAVRTAIHRAFVFGFRLVMLGCAALAAASVAVAFVFPMSARTARPASS